jgi:hypothetical protein
MSFSNFSNGFSKSRRLATFLNRGIEENNITFDGRFIADSGDVFALIDSDYVRLQTRIGDSDISFGSHSIKFNDNPGKAIFGAGDDLQIYHSGSNSFVTDLGTGNLYLGTNGASVNITKGNGTENMGVFTADGAVTLYHNNSAKIATTTTGIAVTGVADVSGHVEAIGVEETVYSLGTTGGTITPNFTNGAIQKITLSSNLTFSAFTSPVAGQSITLIIDTNGTGRTLTSTMLFAGGNKTMSTTDTTDVMTVLYDGTNYLANYVTDFS